MKKLTRILFFCVSIVCSMSVFSQTVTQLRNNYSGNTSWNSTSGTLTFSTSGTIYFSWKEGSGNDPETDQMQNFWNVPTEVKKIVINANVTVTGAFHTFGNCSIEGVNRYTSKVYGTPLERWADKNNPGGQDLEEWYYAQFQNYGGVLNIKNLTSLNPFSYHVRGWGTKVNMDNCDIIDTRGGSGNHSDGYCGGDGSVVNNCYFETGDDVFKVYFNYTANNCTIKMVENAVPIQLGWGDYSNGAHVTFNDLTITGNSGRWSPSNTNAVISGRSGKYDVTVDINGCTIQNPNAHMVMLWESGMTLRGNITDAKIDIKAYTQDVYNKGTDLLTICGNTKHLSSYDCSSNNNNKQAPTGLSATAANGSVTIRWNAISSSDLSRYAIHRGTSTSNIGWIKGSITSNSYTDNTVTNGTKYYYKVEAIYNDGTKLLSSETVSATPGVTNATTRFEAESYSSMSGIKTQSTSDVGGGLNVGYINNNDYCDYTFKVANAGTYTSKFRVASAQNGGKIQILKGTTVLGTVNVATTGGWQTWTTVNGPSINLTSTGTQTIRLKFVNTSTTGFLMNFNWFEITGGGTLKSATMESEELVNQNLSFDLYPNPAHEKITINLNKINESSIVEVFNMQGALVYSQTAEPTLLEIPVTSWKSGVYFVKIKTSEKSLVQKFIVE